MNKIKKRKVIIHRHLFKNAGTTFDKSLSNNFGKDFCDHRDDKPMRLIGQHYLIDHLKNNPNIKALSSHHIWFNPQSQDNIELIPVCLLRHPIERIKSVYNFEKLQQADTIGAKIAKSMSFKEYVSWRMNKDVNPTIRNFQTRYLAGVKKKLLTPLDFEEAKQGLNRFNLCGIVDLYDTSMIVFESKFMSLGIDISLTGYLPKNNTQSVTNINIEERVEHIKNELGDALFTVVLQNNKYDIELYRMAKNKLLEKYRKLSN